MSDMSITVIYDTVSDCTRKGVGLVQSGPHHHFIEN